MKPSLATKQFLLNQLSSFNCYKDIEEIVFNSNNLGGFTVILRNKKRIPSFEFNLFRGNNILFNRYLNTFQRS